MVIWSYAFARPIKPSKYDKIGLFYDTNILRITCPAYFFTNKFINTSLAHMIVPYTKCINDNTFVIICNIL